MEGKKLGILVGIFLLSSQVAAQSQAKLGDLVLKLLCFFFFIFPALLTLLFVVGGFLILKGSKEKRVLGKRIISNGVIAFFILILLAWLVTLTSPELNFSDYAPCFVGGEAPSFPVTTTLPGEMPPWADARGSAFPPPPLPEEKEVYSGPGGSIYFDGSKSIDFNGEVVKYEWNFGDGNSGEGVSTSHIYPNEGEYTVELEVTDDEDLTAKDRIKVYLYPLEAHILKPANGTGFVHLPEIEIKFTGEGKYGVPCAPPNLPYQYHWESNLKGQLSNEKSFVIEAIDLGLGSHLITLTVEDCVGKTASDTITIHIVEPLIAEILSPENDGMTMGCPVNFTGKVSGGLPLYQVKWKANDKVIGTGEISLDGGTHTFKFMPPAVLQPGIYGITFEAKDSVELEASDDKGDIEVVMCDACLTGSSQGPGVAISGAYGYPMQKYSSSTQTITVGTSGVTTATATALAEGINNHPQWGASDPDALTSEQRFQAIYEWITRNMGYLCDQPGGACLYNCPECSGYTLCSCLTPDGWVCGNWKVEGDVWASGEDTITLSPKCCNSGPYEYHGDCDDYAHLFISMSRTAEISEECVAFKLGPRHAFNAAKINKKWEYVDAQAGNYYGWSWSQMLARGGYSCGGFGAHQGYTDYTYHDICGR